MMGKIVEHFINGLQQDCEQLRNQRDISKFDSEARKKKEGKLYQLLSELIETERKYVADLEEVRTHCWIMCFQLFIRKNDPFLYLGLY
jgi:hypothetical protein